MTPDHSLRLATMMRAMLDVVIPAIDPKQRLALDQAQIVVGNLRILLDQAGKDYQYEFTELREYHKFVHDLGAVAAGGEGTRAALDAARELLAATQPLVVMAAPAHDALAAQVRRLKLAADALLQAAYRDGAADYRAAADRLVHAQAERQLTRERVWFRRAGFELEPDRLPSMDEVLATDVVADQT